MHAGDPLKQVHEALESCGPKNGDFVLGRASGVIARRKIPRGEGGLYSVGVG